MTPIDKLIAYFEKFPGIGGRQAKRFAFHILTLKAEQVAELASLITSLPQSVSECSQCHRFFSLQRQPTDGKCPICADLSRDQSKLIVVARDSDIQAIERSGVYDGLYFVLGGTVPLLGSSESNSRVRTPAFRALITQKLEQGLNEIIFAFSVNPDGENTGRYIENVLKEISGTDRLKISELGRGLSTGSELEYADSETIKNALRNRG
jgi:recombination protein RecR